ncbi:helix-turn-helix transcriptional regulator [Limosilactobacillus sp. STM2_1]|uniref:Helix-turn-helix transcriptional regulator n=1 Tax=Limosilactobacillus rudii TaxID=2759755 RepID=A0A7W3YNS0_9LACO|nr:AraC family transcriptional regulator [Limosilactobacillus rudii]MBB1079916.1 helix-turn-helix transcriptional regulator [Limosilactobacillus rudii]MBB1097995.1 helix-turn-helix transcriptional regulator [Limosilactobacillus rudii]MCD7135064.1 AraC family transcriptional regulator [Limosilactobacillus rudii]
MKVTYFNINQPVVAVNQGFFSATKAWKHKRIYQDEAFEIIIVNNGPLYLQIDQQQYTIRTNEMLLVPAKSVVRGWKDSPFNTQYYWFHFFPAPQSTHKGKFIHNPEKINQGIIPLPLQFKLPEIKKSYVLANQVLDIANNPIYPHIAIDYLLTELLIELSNDFVKSFTTTSNNKISIIQGWIRSHLSQHLTVDQIATHFEFNANYLERIFKQQTDLTIIQYINQLKLEKAQELLSKTNLPIKQIAALSFFNDDKHFMKQFKKVLRLTPSEFRKSYSSKFQDSDSFDPQKLLSKDTDINYCQRFNLK